MITFKPKIDSLYDAVIFFFNCLDVARPPHLRIAPSEVEVLAEFVCLPEKFKYYRFSSHAKKAVIKAFAAKEKHLSMENVNNKIYSLLLKEILYKDEDKVVYLDKTIEKALSVLIYNYNSHKETLLAYSINNERSTDEGTWWSVWTGS